MKASNVHYYPSVNNEFAQRDPGNAVYDALLVYSIRHLTAVSNASPENIWEALQKSLQLCYSAGINSTLHFKQIFLFDSNNGTLLVDWRMSKPGFNLMVTQIPTINEKVASWVWKLAEN